MCSFPISVLLRCLSYTARTDFEVINRLVMFESGQTELNISIGILDDAVDEGAEQFRITLTRPPDGGVYLGAITHANVTIIDNDGKSSNQITIREY